MKLGLQINSFTWPGGPAAIGPTLARIVRQADDVGFDSIWVMDHFFQIRGVGRIEEPMLEGWTTLGFIAAHTQRARLGLMVGGVHYRHPGLWVKAATTLDVLSGGRAWLGIGAAWNEEESRGARASRSRRSASASRCSRRRSRSPTRCGPASAGPEEAFAGPPLPGRRGCSTPRSRCRGRGSPIMIGGGGERKTLRLVAQYADACNVFGAPEAIDHKYEILARALRRGRPRPRRDRAIDAPERAPRARRRGATAADRRPLRRARRRRRPARDLQRRGRRRPGRLERLGRDVIPQLRDPVMIPPGSIDIVIRCDA